uniref:Uncharacterized protein n=1 Tax=Arundo donax TaxID=35708 RepID=A0A0A9G675_ARUDO
MRARSQSATPTPPAFRRSIRNAVVSVSVGSNRPDAILPNGVVSAPIPSTLRSSRVREALWWFLGAIVIGWLVAIR